MLRATGVPGMRPLSRWFLTLFASPAGVFAIALLDSTPFFWIPFGLDAAVIILAARLGHMAWSVPLLAATGSVIGSAVTYWMGTKIGDKGLDRYVPARRLANIRERVHEKGAIALGALSIVPPPFPFTPFVLAAGALDVEPAAFFATIAGSRLLRFAIEAMLAANYGRRIVRWLESSVFQDLVIAFVVLTAVLTTISMVRVIRSTRPIAQEGT